MRVGVRTEDAFGNPRGGFDGRVMVLLHDAHVSFANSAESSCSSNSASIRSGNEVRTVIRGITKNDPCPIISWAQGSWELSRKGPTDRP